MRDGEEIDGSTSIQTEVMPVHTDDTFDSLFNLQGACLPEVRDWPLELALPL